LLDEDTVNVLARHCFKRYINIAAVGSLENIKLDTAGVRSCFQVLQRCLGGRLRNRIDKRRNALGIGQHIAQKLELLRSQLTVEEINTRQVFAWSS
jgi:hypothetical protein